MSQIQKKFIAPNAADGTKVRLDNNQTLRGRNNANSADVNILKVNTSDRVEFSSVPQSTSDASSANDLVRFSQFSAALDGLKPKAAVVAATTANINLASATNPNPIDGVTLSNGDRVLLWNQTAPAENGVYVATTATNPTTWVRSSDFDAPSEIPGAYTVAEFGTLYQGTLFVSTSSPGVIGTDPINFAMRAITVNTYTGGDMITLTGSAFSVDLAATSGLESSNPGNAAGQLRVKLEASNPSLKITGSNELAVKLDPAGAIASGAGGIATQVDGSTIEINTNALRVKDAGIVLAKLASNSVDENKIVSTAISTTGALNGGGGTKLSSRVDASTIKINGSNNLEGLKELEQKITLASGDITSQFVDLAHAIFGVDAANNSASLFVVGGPMQEKAVDYTVSLTGGSGGVTRISFAGDLATGGAAALVSGDKLVIKYQYLT